MIKANLIIFIVVAVLAISAMGFWVVRDIQNSKIQHTETAAQPVAEQKEPIDSPKTATLKQPSDNPEALLQSGILKKNARDYEGAQKIWEYVVKIRPEDWVAYNNLGDLYHHYLKDYPKAEFYYKKVIELKPDYLQTYTNLHDLYRLFYPTDRQVGAEKAEAILLEGIQKNSNDYYLRVVLASYYKDRGDKINARKYYEEALTLNPPNKAAIEEELKGL